MKEMNCGNFLVEYQTPGTEIMDPWTQTRSKNPRLRNLKGQGRPQENLRL